HDRSPTGDLRASSTRGQEEWRSGSEGVVVARKMQWETRLHVTDRAPRAGVLRRRRSRRIVPAPAERDLGAVFLDELGALRGRPAELAGEDAGDALAYAEALVAADQQQWDPAREDI